MAETHKSNHGVAESAFCARPQNTAFPRCIALISQTLARMSRDSPTATHHSNVSNLTNLYEPIRHFGRALRGPDTSCFSDSYHSRYSRHDKGAYSPNFDLRETPDAYHFEGEFPGVKDCSAIKLQWIDQHTLQIEGVLETTHSSENGAQTEGDTRIGSHSAQEPPELHETKRAGTGQNSASTRVWLTERRTGSFRRSFSFPVAIDTDAIEATLSQGLLRVIVPKIDKSLFKSKDVPINVIAD